MNFEQLDIPDQWQQYWTKYPQGYTILEALINWVSQVNDMVDSQNSWEDYLENFKATIDDRLKPFVDDVLYAMASDGTLDQIINQNIFNDLNAEIDATKKHLSAQINPANAPYNADATGTTDVTATFNQALNDLTAVGGGTLSLPDGDFLVSNLYNHDLTNISIKGSNGTTIIRNANTRTFDLRGNNITVENLNFDNNGMEDWLVIINDPVENTDRSIRVLNPTIRDIRCVQDHFNARGVLIGLSDNALIENCSLENMFSKAGGYQGFGICSQATVERDDNHNVTKSYFNHNTRIINNHVKGYTHGIYTYGSGRQEEMYISGNFVEFCMTAGIYAYHSPGSRIIGNHIQSVDGLAIWSDNSSDESGYTNGNIVSDNYIKICENGILTEEWNGGIISGNSITNLSGIGIMVGGGTHNTTISGNSICFNGGEGIRVDKTQNPNQYDINNLTVTGNIIVGNGKDGIWAGNVEGGFSITDNQLLVNGQLDDGVTLYSEIECVSNTRDLYIANNILGRPTTYISNPLPEKSHYVLRLGSSTDTNDAMVTGNKFHHNNGIFVQKNYGTLVLTNNYFRGASTFAIDGSTPRFEFGNAGGRETAVNTL